MTEKDPLKTNNCGCGDDILNPGRTCDSCIEEYIGELEKENEQLLKTLARATQIIHCYEWAGNRYLVNNSYEDFDHNLVTWNKYFDDSYSGAELFHCNSVAEKYNFELNNSSVDSLKN